MGDKLYPLVGLLLGIMWICSNVWVHHVGQKTGYRHGYQKVLQDQFKASNYECVIQIKE